MANGSNNKVICAICYEEAKPASEDLQSISLCGHVFHELCLQQWLEYCPRGRKCTCPLCKQQCSDKDVHRLYFQSASEATQASQGNCSELTYACDDVEALQATVQKLTGQLSVTKSSLEAHQEQLQESNRQLSLFTLRAEKAESALVEARREKSSLKDAHAKLQEELKRSTAERCKLVERNTSLTKELASNNLVQNLDVDEDDVVRMARVGCGNKDDVIGTLTRSLIVRNRAYKDLMARCNELGTGENKALRKYEKAFERIKVLKARVQELERSLEDKENGNLRWMKVSSSLCNNDTISPVVVTTKNLGISSKPPLPLQPSSRTKQNSTTSSEPVKIVNAVRSSHVSKNSCSFLEEEEVRFSNLGEVHLSEKREVAKASHISMKDTFMSFGSSGNRGSVNGSNISLEDGISQDNGILPSTREKSDELDKDILMETEDNLSRSYYPVTIKKELRLSASTVSETGTTTSIRDNQMPNQSKWCKQSSSWNAQHGDPSTGTFISFGANGRGGLVKVLRPPPMLQVGGVSSCDNWLRPAKKAKSSRNVQNGNQHGSLQIEHFFGGL